MKKVDKQSITKRPPNIEFQKSAPGVFYVALKNSNFNTYFFAECVIFCTFLDVKRQGFSKKASKLLYLS